MMDQPTQPPGQPIWKVVSVIDTGINDPIRGYVPGYRVTVKLFDQSTFTLDFPKTEFGADVVRQRIDDEVAKHVEVRGLQGQSLQY